MILFSLPGVEMCSEIGIPSKACEQVAPCGPVAANESFAAALLPAIAVGRRGRTF